MSYTDEQEGSEDSFPFGSEPEGFLIYTRGGFVSAQLMKPGRSLFQSHNWRRGTPDEYQQAGLLTLPWYMPGNTIYESRVAAAARFRGERLLALNFER